MSLELIPLCTVTITSGGLTELGTTPAGRRYMTRIAESIWEGERLHARLEAGTLAGDWLVVSPDGVGQIDIWLTIKTHDGALIYVQYFGRRDFTQVDAGIEAPVYQRRRLSAPAFRHEGESRVAYWRRRYPSLDHLASYEVQLGYENVCVSGVSYAPNASS